MLPFRRHQPEPTPWTQAPVCAEYHASGLELRLIDLVDQREQAIRAGRDVVRLDVEIAEVNDELARVAVDPLYSTYSPAA